MKVSKNKGQSLVEYALILALVTIVGLLAISSLGGQLKSSMQNLNNEVQQANQNSQENSGT